MSLEILYFQLVAHSFRKTWGWHGFLPIVVLDSRHPVPLSCSSAACPERSRRVAGRWSPACPERSRRVTVLHKSFRMRGSKNRLCNPFECAVAKTPCGGYFSPHPEGDADPEKCSAEGPLKFCF